MSCYIRWQRPVLILNTQLQTLPRHPFGLPEMILSGLVTRWARSVLYPSSSCSRERTPWSTFLLFLWPSSSSSLPSFSFETFKAKFFARLYYIKTFFSIVSSSIIYYLVQKAQKTHIVMGRDLFANIICQSILERKITETEKAQRVCSGHMYYFNNKSQSIRIIHLFERMLTFDTAGKKLD